MNLQVDVQWVDVAVNLKQANCYQRESIRVCSGIVPVR